MTAYEDTVELTGKGNVENNIELSLASVELTGKGDIPTGGFPDPYTPWQYRKPITLNNGGNAQSDYQVLITLTTANFDYGKCKNDGGDIRFAASDGETELSYWIEDWNYNGDSKIWAKVDSIPEGSSTIYIYYGKGDATSESNKGATMLLWIPCDDSNEWTISDTNDITIADGKLKVLSTCNSGETAHITDKPTLGDDWVLKFTYKKKAELSGERASTFGVSDAISYSDSGNEIFIREYDDGSNVLLTRSIVENIIYSGTNLNNPLIDELYTIQFKKLGNSVNIKIWDTSHSEANPNTDDDLTAKDSYEFPYITLALRSTGGDEGEFDDITIRKYASSEPTHSIGAEQTGIPFCTLTLHQSAEIEGKGDLIAFRSYQDLVELTATGGISADAIWAQHELLELTGIGYIFSGPYIAWNYKRGVKVTNYTGGELTDYPVEVVLTTENFDYAKCELDGSDIRFGAGNDALSYWVEDWNYNGTSRIWVKASIITEGFNVCLYIYHGKAGEESESNGDNVWNVVFDHFTGDTLDPTKWEEFGTPTSSLTVTVQDGHVKVRSVSYQSRAVGIKSINEIGSSYRGLTRLKFGSLHWGSYYNFWNAIGQSLDASNLNSVFFWQDQFGANPPNIRHASRAAGTWSFAEYQINDYDWHRYLNKKSETSHHKAKQDAESELELTSNVYSGIAPFRILHQHDNTYLTTHTSYLDYVAITDKYATPDPIASLVPEEEEEEISLTARWALSQSAEIEGKGDPTCLLSFQPLLELVAAGDISADTISAFHELHEFTGVGDFLVPHVHIFADLDSFLIENFSIRKTIQDPFWKFKGDVENITVPAYFKTLRIIEPDHEGTDRCIFLGFIPGAGFDLAVANDKATLNGFDQAWYLQAQYVPTSLRVTDEDTNPATIISTLLGNASWANVTGIEPYCINSVTGWSAIKKSFIFDTQATKWKAIQEICAYCHHVFLVKWRKTEDNQYYSCAYFVHEDELDDYLDLPDKATITNPDDLLISRVKKGDGGSTEYPVQIEEAETEKYNRITVSGIDIETGTWYHKTVESPGVISGDEIPIEFKYESSDLDTQVKVDFLADALYLFYHTIAKYYYASFNSRMDFELYQKLEFIDFPDIPDELMRITGLTFDCQKIQNIVTVLFTSDQKLSDLRKLLRSMGKKYTPDWLDLAKIAVGTILEISESGKTALVEIDRDETIVRARILNP